MPNALTAQHVDYVSTMLHLCMKKAGLAVQAGGSPAFSTANSVDYLIDGVFYTKGAVASQSLVTNSVNPETGAAFTAGDLTIPLASTGYFLVCLDAAGNVKVFAGVKRAPNGSVTFSGQLPDYPIGYAAIGFIKIVTTTAQFVPGTTALDAAGLTVTFKDIACGGLNLAP